MIGGRAKTTNLPGIIEETALGQALNLNRNSVHLINDLEAILSSADFAANRRADH